MRIQCLVVRRNANESVSIGRGQPKKIFSIEWKVIRASNIRLPDDGLFSVTKISKKQNIRPPKNEAALFL